MLLASDASERYPPARGADADTKAEERAQAIAAQAEEIAYLRLMRRQYLWGIANLQENLAMLRYQQDRLQSEIEQVFGPTPVDHPVLASLATQMARLPEQHQAFSRAEARALAMLAKLEADLREKESLYAGDAASAVAGF